MAATKEVFFKCSSNNIILYPYLELLPQPCLAFRWSQNCDKIKRKLRFKLLLNRQVLLWLQIKCNAFKKFCSQLNQVFPTRSNIFPPWVKHENNGEMPWRRCFAQSSAWQRCCPAQSVALAGKALPCNSRSRAPAFPWGAGLPPCRAWTLSHQIYVWGRETVQNIPPSTPLEGEPLRHLQSG